MDNYIICKVHPYTFLYVLIYKKMVTNLMAPYNLKVEQKSCFILFLKTVIYYCHVNFLI